MAGAKKDDSRVWREVLPVGSGSERDGAGVDEAGVREEEDFGSGEVGEMAEGKRGQKGGKVRLVGGVELTGNSWWTGG